MFSFVLRSCTSSILAQILDPEVPFVWIRRHIPNYYVQWWNTRVRLSKKGMLHEAEVRSMEFELQLPTARFLELLPEFEDHGIELFQMTRRVPDSLTLNRLTGDALNRVLIQNGLHLSFYLPHAVEMAQLESPHREILERVLQKPKVRKFAHGTS